MKKEKEKGRERREREVEREREKVNNEGKSLPFLWIFTNFHDFFVSSPTNCLIISMENLEKNLLQRKILWIERK